VGHGGAAELSGEQMDGVHVACTAKENIGMGSELRRTQEEDPVTTGM
jgi:hypothetical protein